MQIRGALFSSSILISSFTQLLVAAEPGVIWSKQLAGTITASPAIADVDGDGKPEIIVPTMGMTGEIHFTDEPPEVVTDRDLAARVVVIHADGKELYNIAIMDAGIHKAAQSSDDPDWWIAAPAAIELEKNKHTIAIARPNGITKGQRGISIISPDGKETRLPAELAFPDPGATIPLIRYDALTVVLLGGKVNSTIAGTTIPDWESRKIAGGFGTCAGDIDNDGTIEAFVVGYRHGESNGVIMGYDHEGKSLKGWPQKIGRQSYFAPVVGNIFGDDHLEIIAPDQHSHILAWTFDGQRFGTTFEELKGQPTQGGESKTLTAKDLEAEKCSSIFKDNIRSIGSPALADLDGDGLAEVIVLDGNTQTIRAWHGDGKPVMGDDGVITKIDSVANGVSVCGPDQNGAFDLFAGANWIHLDKSMKASITTMTTGKDSKPANSIAQDSVADIDADGLADVIIGTSDGKLIAYRTNIPYTNAWAQWPTQGGNVQRTGEWKKPK